MTAPTANELAFLRGLAWPAPRSRDGRWHPRDMIASQPAFAGKHTSGLHMTAHSLVSKGLVRRRKLAERVAYQLTDAGRALVAVRQARADAAILAALDELEAGA